MRTISKFQICNSDLFINIPMTYLSYNLKLVFFSFYSSRYQFFTCKIKVCFFLEWSFELSKFNIEKVIKNVLLNGCED